MGGYGPLAWVSAVLWGLVWIAVGITVISWWVRGIISLFTGGAQGW